MRSFYVDETGFTGEDLMARDQSIFVQATTDFSDGEARELISSSFGRHRGAELKYNRIRRTSSGRAGAIALVKALSSSSNRAGTWLAHKQFAMMTLVVEWWMEPLAHKLGMNMHAEGAALATANMLYFTLEGFWSAEFRRDLLLHFQRMFRERTPQTFYL
jgi:hypothetical protein